MWGETTVMMILLASSHSFIIIHCYLALHDSQSRMKCPDLKESEMYSLKPWVYYVALAICSMAELAIYIWIGSVVLKQNNSMKGFPSQASLKRRKEVMSSTLLDTSFTFLWIGWQSCYGLCPAEEGSRQGLDLYSWVVSRP